MGSGIGHDYNQARSAFRLSADINLPAYLADAFPNAFDAETGASRFAHAAAIVFHFQHDGCRMVRQTDADLTGAGVTNGVCESFLGDANQIGFLKLVEGMRRAFQPRFELHSGVRYHLTADLLDCFEQRAVGQHAEPESRDGTPRLIQARASELA